MKGITVISDPYNGISVNATRVSKPNALFTAILYDRAGVGGNTGWLRGRKNDTFSGSERAIRERLEQFSTTPL